MAGPTAPAGGAGKVDRNQTRITSGRMIRPARLMKIWLYVVLVVLALPLLAMTALSLNQSRYGTFPFHFTFDWYANLAHDQALVDALLTSVNLATQATIVAVIVGTLLALGMARAKVFVNLPINGLLLALLTVPALILAALAYGASRGFSYPGQGSAMSRCSGCVVLLARRRVR